MIAGLHGGSPTWLRFRPAKTFLAQFLGGFYAGLLAPVLEIGIQDLVFEPWTTVMIMPLVVGGIERPAVIPEIQEAGVALMNRFACSMHTSRDDPEFIISTNDIIYSPWCQPLRGMVDPRPDTTTAGPRLQIGPCQRT